MTPSQTKKATLLFVPGAWHTPDCYDPTTDLLKAAGYTCIGIYLPSVVTGPPYAKDFTVDVEAIRAAILKEADASNDVILIMHSYGGVPGGAACDGLLKEQRKEQGKMGGVIGLVYLTSLPGPIGFSVAMNPFAESKENLGLSPWAQVEDDGYIIPQNPANVFYNDLPPEVAQKHIEKLRRQSLGPFLSQQTYEPWRHVPATYLQCEKDNAIPIPIQEMLCEGKGFTIAKLDCGHSPFLSRPQETAEVIRRAAGESV